MKTWFFFIAAILVFNWAIEPEYKKLGPHPLVFLNLGHAYFEKQEYEKARLYWDIGANFEKIFRKVKLKHCKKAIWGCQISFKHTDFLNDPLYRRGK